MNKLRPKRKKGDWIAHVVFGLLATLGLAQHLIYNNAPLEILLVGLITLMLVSHMIFGEYFAVSSLGEDVKTFAQKLTFSLLRLVGIVMVSLVVYSIFNPIYWAALLALLMVLAIGFHVLIKKTTSSIQLQEFANYKIYIEIYGFILSLSSIALMIWFPGFLLYILMFGVFIVLHLNHIAIFKKKIYSLDFIELDYSKEPLVTVVVITYNEEESIDATLQHLVDQTYEKYEVIVVDDRSKDKTVEKAKKYKDKLDLNIVIKETDRGPSHSRNLGASLAKGEIILFLDADTLANKDAIENMVATMKEKHLGVATLGFMHDATKPFDIFLSKYYGKWLKLVQYYNPRAVGYCMVAAKKVHDKILFDPTVVIAEDFDYVRRASWITKFRVIDSAHVITSWRRFRMENKLVLILRYLFVEFYRQNIGEVRKKIVSYEFGQYKKSDMKDS